jgi:hypothetical protein
MFFQQKKGEIKRREKWSLDEHSSPETHTPRGVFKALIERAVREPSNVRL